MAWSNLYTIEIYLNNQSKLISFYKNMKIAELDGMIRFAFKMDEKVDIIGLEDEMQRIIPLSYLSLDPRRLNEQQRYRILTNPLQLVRSIPQTLILYIFLWLLLIFGIILFYFGVCHIYSSYHLWIRYLYFYGPGIYLIGTGIQFGGWNGNNNYLICAKLTDTNASLWYDAKQECEEMIERNIKSTIIGFETIAAIIIIFYGLKILRQLLFAAYHYISTCSMLL